VTHVIALVTGEIGCGKTTVCQRVVGLLHERGVSASGILAPARLGASGVKIGIDVVDIASEERRCLATRVAGGGETIGDYTFDQAALNWAIDRLLEAIATLRANGDTHVLLVDEIGPLELVRQGGFVAALGPLAERHKVPRAVVVVRREYVDALTRRLDRRDAHCFRVDETSRERLPTTIAEAFD
jgi:nucleoside-triphosphatase THEP1